MDHATQQQFENLWSRDRVAQNTAFFAMLEQTNQPVDWVYEVWGTLVEELRHLDNHNRAIAAQILCNLAKSDPECRIIQDLPALLAVTKDPRFVTARHCMQSLWKVESVHASKKPYSTGLSIVSMNVQPKRIAPSFVMTFSKVCAMFMILLRTKASEPDQWP